MQSGLAFEHVDKTFGPIRALRDLDLEIPAGELMVLVGPSGCGKTTALRIAAGLEEVTEGRVRIGDRDVTRTAPSKRDVSMVFQSFALFPHLTVAENIGFGLAVRRTPRAEARDRVATVAAMIGCEHLLQRRPFQLSGGERQRVALARAVVRNPLVFLLDEPLSSLDAQLRVQMRAELKRLHQRVGRTMVYVTHDQVEALTLGDRVAVLREGTVEQVGAPDEVYRRPASRFVATFIGSPAMNVLRGTVEGRTVRAGPFVLGLPLAPESRDVEVGVRPERVLVSSPADLSARMDGAHPAEVQVVEVAGSETFLHLGVDDHVVVARVAADLRPAVGDRVAVRIPERALYVFDRQSGRTLVQAG